jgi:hypothetical protein
MVAVQRTSSAASCLLQYNNLFGYGEPKSHSEIEVNFPMEKPRRTLQGALVYDTTAPNSILLAHRGRVEHGGPHYVHDQMQNRGATLITVAGNSRPLIRVCSITALNLQDIIDFVRNILM